MIIAKCGDFTLEHDEDMGYAVFERQHYPSGTTSFWQQITKWYWYKKYAEDKYRELTEPKVDKVGRALEWAEKYGIIDYIIDGIYMVYHQTFRGEGTYLVKVDLDLMKETERKLVKKC